MKAYALAIIGLIALPQISAPCFARESTKQKEDTPETQTGATEAVEADVANAGSEGEAEEQQFRPTLLYPEDMQKPGDPIYVQQKLVLNYDVFGVSLPAGGFELTLSDGMLTIKHFRTNRMGFITEQYDHRDSSPVELPINLIINGELLIPADFLLGKEEVQFKLPPGLDIIQVMAVQTGGGPHNARFAVGQGALKDTAVKKRKSFRARGNCGGVFGK